MHVCICIYYAYAKKCGCLSSTKTSWISSTPLFTATAYEAAFCFGAACPPPFLLLWNSYSYSPDCIFRHYQKDLCCSLIRVCCSKVHRCLHCMLPSVIFRNIIQEGRSNPGCFCSSMKYMVAGCWWGRGIGRR